MAGSDQDFKTFLHDMGFFVVPPENDRKDACSVIEAFLNLPTNTVGKSISVDLFDKCNDGEFRSRWNLTNQREFEEQCTEFFENDGEAANQALAMELASQHYNINITVYSSSGKITCYPESRDEFDRKASFFHQCDKDFYILSVSNCNLIDKIQKIIGKDEDEIQFRQRLSMEGFDILNVPSDNNCLFQALALSNGDVSKDQNTIRKETYEYLLANQAVEKFKIPFEKTVDQLKMLSDWRRQGRGHHIHLVAASEIYEVNISVHFQNSIHHEIPESPNLDRKTLHISYHNLNHYNALRPKQPNPSLPISNERNQPNRPGNQPQSLRNSDTSVDITVLQNQNAIMGIGNASTIQNQNGVAIEIEEAVGTSVSENLELNPRSVSRRGGINATSNENRLSMGKRKNPNGNGYLRNRSGRGNLNRNVYRGSSGVRSSINRNRSGGGENEAVNRGIGTNASAENNHDNMDIELQQASGSSNVEMDISPEVGADINDDAMEQRREDNDGSNGDDIAQSEDTNVESNDDMGQVGNSMVVEDNHANAQEDFDSMEYVNSSIYKSGREQLDVLIVLYGANHPDSLLEALDKDPEIPVYILVDYNRPKFQTELLNDAEVCRHAKVWHITLEKSWTGEWKPRYTWLSMLMVVPLVFAVTCGRWHRHPIRPLMLRSPKAMIMILLGKIWGRAGGCVRPDLEHLENNPNDLLCYNCNSQCAMANRPWHLNLSKFVMINFPMNPDGYNFWTRFSFHMNPIVETDAQLLVEIQRFLDNNGSVRQVLDTIDQHFTNVSTNNKYTSYTVLILDGRNMRNYQNLNTSELIAKEDVYKLVYTGASENEFFRRGHFQDVQSGVTKFLSNTTRIFYIRRKEFRDFVDSRQDEAMIIEILKTNSKAYRERHMDPPYYIVNENSEIRQLLTLSTEMQQNIAQFESTNVPIFAVDQGGGGRGYENHKFTGNYPIGEEVNMMDGDYQNREFLDVEPEYIKLTHAKKK